MTDSATHSVSKQPDPGGQRRWRLVMAGSDGVPASPGGSRRRPVSRRTRVLRLLAALTVLVLLGGGVWVVYGTGLFAVTTVRVVGTEVLTPAQVRTAAAVPPGTLLARVDTDRATRRVARLAPVAEVVVERDWPDTVVIRVRERTPVAVVRTGDRYLVLDGSGVVFDAKPERPSQLPLLAVRRPGPKDAMTRDALRVLAALTTELRTVLVKLEASSSTRITLRLTRGRTVIWGDAERSRRKAQVATALLKHRVSVIDVSAPDVVTTR